MAKAQWKQIIEDRKEEQELFEMRDDHALNAILCVYFLKTFTFRGIQSQNSVVLQKQQ